MLTTIAAVDIQTKLFGLASAVFSNETNMPGSTLSCVNLAAAISLPVEGVHGVCGGYTWLLSELAKTVRYGGGRVITDVPIHGIDLEPASSGGRGGKKLLRVRGVRVGGFGDDEEERTLKAPKVVSGVGALCTYMRLLPSTIPLSDGSGSSIDVDRKALCHLREACPKLCVLLSVPTAALSLGTSEELFSGDYFELNYPSSPPENAEDTLGLIGGSGFVRVWSPEVQASEPGTSLGNRCMQYISIPLSGVILFVCCLCVLTVCCLLTLYYVTEWL